MASSFMRFFNAPPEYEEGTIFTMSASVTDVIDVSAVRDFLQAETISIHELTRDQHICRDEDGNLMSWREVVLRPPLSNKQVKLFGSIVLDVVDTGHNLAYVIDCREHPEALYKDVITYG